MRAIVLGRIAPAQSIAIDENGFERVDVILKLDTNVDTDRRSQIAKIGRLF